MEDNYLHKGLRRKLIKTLIEKGIDNETVLKAIEKIPRHCFLDNAFLEHAYQDKAFPIGEKQTISQPYTVAIQSALLDVSPKMKVLEIGTGSGYQSCVLLELGVELYTIEFHKSLSEKAKKMVHSLGYQAHFYHGDGSEGLEQFGPYDRILATAGAPFVSEKLIRQLKIGGKLVIPVGNESVQKMLLITRTSESNYTEQSHGNFKFVPLVGKEGWNKTSLK
jgi:protein-L-isoaspartate(D-aspartate) O-methyltransferase